MTSKTPLGLDFIQKMATGGKVDEYEFGPCAQYGAKVTVICRRKRTEAQTPV